MLTIKRKFAALSISALMLTLVGCSDSDDGNNPILSNAGPTLDIVETAAANGNFTTLLAAVEAADLVEALKGEGPLTVFAPTDDAFAALPEGTVEALLADTDALTAILTYHVTVGEVRAAQVVTSTTIPTLNGAELTVTVNGDGSVMIDGANVTITDIETTNGIIHVIDAVVTPSVVAGVSATVDGSSVSARGFGYGIGGGWISEAIKEGRLQWLTKRLSLYTVSRLTGLNTLTTAVKAADLKSTLQKNGPFTVFGPTNDAFSALPDGTVAALLQDKGALSNILLYHVVPKVVKAAEVVTLTQATMANGQTVDITAGSGGVMVNNTNVIVVDIPARNGVIHLIDNVLIPKSQ
jgi:uncharacterized surface protein with fasciclin (FAS1) repeats